MEIYKIQEITDYMESVCPSNYKSNYQAIAKKYIDICVYECLRGYNDLKEDKDTIDFRISNLNENIHSRFNRTEKWLPLLKKNFPFFYTVQRGWKNSGVSVLSSVKPVFDQLTLLKYLCKIDTTDIIAELYPAGEDKVIETPIDLNNLNRYIENMMFAVKNNKFQYPQKIMNRVFTAKCILDMAIANQGVLPQRYSIKATGRQYHKGINLQNCSADVREAAIGECHKYDLRSSMFAVMLDVIHNWKPIPDDELKKWYLYDMIHHKKEIRKRLAKDCLTNTNADQDFKEKIIKSALQKIGFGSNPHNPFGGVAKDIYHEVDRMQFAKHWTVKGLLEEVELYKAVMKKDYPEAKKQFGDDLRKNGRSSLNKWCTYHYQLTESVIIQFIKQSLGEEHILLQVHDALYFSKRIEIDELNYIAKKVSKHCVFEYEHVKKQGTNRNLLQQADHIVQEHRKHIAKEEQRATEHVLEFSNIHTTTGKDRIDKQLELQQAWNTLMEKQ